MAMYTLPKMTYKPEYAETLLKYMEKGLSNLQIAAKFKIAEKTFYAWRKDHPEFQEAYDIGNPMRFTFLMEQADKAFLEERNDKGYKHWLKKMQHIYRDYAPDKVEQTTNNNYQIGNVNVLEYQGKSDAELYDLIQIKLGKIKPIDNQLVHKANNLIEGVVVDLDKELPDGD